MHICGTNCSGVLLNYLWCVTQPADVCIAPGWRHARIHSHPAEHIWGAAWWRGRGLTCAEIAFVATCCHMKIKKNHHTHTYKKKKKKTEEGTVFMPGASLSESQQQWQQSSQSGGALHTAPMNTLIRVSHWGRQVSSSLPLISKEHCSSCNGSQNQTGIFKCHSRPANYTGRSESS